MQINNVQHCYHVGRLKRLKHIARNKLNGVDQNDEYSDNYNVISWLFGCASIFGSTQQYEVIQSSVFTSNVTANNYY